MLERKYMKIKSVLIILGLLVVLVLSGCGASQQAFLGMDVDMGPIPEDVCYINGIPQILSASTESDGDIKLFYLRNNGDYVMQQYSFPGIRKAGSIYWSGGMCQ